MPVVFAKTPCRPAIWIVGRRASPRVLFGYFLHNAKSDNPFSLQRISKFCKPRISTPQPQLHTATIKTFQGRIEVLQTSNQRTKKHLRTTQLNPFEPFQGLSNFESAYSSKHFPANTFQQTLSSKHFPLKIPISQKASKTVKNPIQAPKAAKKRIKRPKRRKESPKKLKKGEKRGWQKEKKVVI